MTNGHWHKKHYVRKKELDKRSRLALILATKAIAKCIPLQDELTKLVKDKGMKMLQGWVVDKIMASKDEVDRIQREAKHTLAKKGGNLILSMEDVQQIAATASDAMKLGNGMLKTVKSFTN